ncbi:MAG: hypothetical protein EA398_15205 [Deltaproteobacteria bacterium]|nr:MAG: hypothetical protein EA398_15205 [Deltaproteobacteria bacterium]
MPLAILRTRVLLPAALAIALGHAGPPGAAEAGAPPVRLVEVLVGARGHDAQALFEPAWADIRALPQCVPLDAARHTPLVDLDLDIGQEGIVQALTVRTRETTLENPESLTCIRERVAALVFLAHEADEPISARIIVRFGTQAGMPVVATIRMPEPTPDPPAQPPQEDRTAPEAGVLATLLGSDASRMGSGGLSSLDGALAGQDAIDDALSGSTGRGSGAAATGEPSASRRVPIRILESSVDVDGERDANIIRRTVRRYQRSIHSCVETSIRDDADGTVSGAFAIGFTITEQGATEDANVEDVTDMQGMARDDLEECIAAQVARWRFDHTAGQRARVTQHLVVERNSPP